MGNSMRIYTERKHNTALSWHIVYEWENQLQKHFNAKLYDIPRVNKRNYFLQFFNNYLKRITKHDLSNLFIESFSDNELAICFEMFPQNIRTFRNNKNTIPIIIDFFWKKEWIKMLNYSYKNCPAVFVTSLEALNFLKNNGCYLPLLFLPISLPDLFNQELTNEERKYDIALVGRVNPVLKDYLKTYERERPEIEYVYADQRAGRIIYRSNKTSYIGEYNTRMKYIKLLKSVKVALYSTPGMDGGEARTRGFNPVTPRFLEFMSAGLHIAARYPKNEDTDYFNLQSISDSITTYSQFKTHLDQALFDKPLPFRKNSEYLKQHYFSQRIPIISKALGNVH